MHEFAYARARSIADAVALLTERGAAARPLAGGTDLVIRLRDGSLTPDLVVDVKAIPELRPDIRRAGGIVTITAGTTMADVAASPLIRASFPTLAEAAGVVGAVQIRNRATLAGNICNASPAADCAPPLLVHDARVVVAGSDGIRWVPIGEWFVRSGLTALLPGELVTAIDVPEAAPGTGSAYERRTRRRGHDLASVTLACLVEVGGTTRLAYGSVGPRPVLRIDASGLLADPLAPDWAKAEVFERLFAGATPSATSMRAAPDYRLAMLRVLGARALATALERRAAAKG